MDRALGPGGRGGEARPGRRLVGGVAHDFNDALTSLNALSISRPGGAGERRPPGAPLGDDVKVDGAGALVRQLLDFLREDPPELRGGASTWWPSPGGAPGLRRWYPRRWPSSRAPAARDGAPGRRPRPPAPPPNLLLDAIIAVADQAAPESPALRRRLRGRRPLPRPRHPRGDNGPGIPEAHRASIFEPFFTTKGKARACGCPAPGRRCAASGASSSSSAPNRRGRRSRCSCPVGLPDRAARSRWPPGRWRTPECALA